MCVTKRSFTSFLRTLLVKIGLDPDNLTGHSFRRGGVGVVIMYQSPKSYGWSIGCHYTINFKNFLLKTFISSCPVAIAQEGYFFQIIQN